MDFHTAVLRQSGSYWVALCLENGIVGQGETQESAILKLKEAVESFQETYNSNPDIYCAPVAIQELHEFLTVKSDQDLTADVYELRAIYA